MNKIEGVRTNNNHLEVWVDGRSVKLKPSLKVWNHSPSGFEAGYAGSGPAQLALAILMMFTDNATASRLHQFFKFDYLADSKFNADNADSFEINVDIEAWIKEALIAQNLLRG